jgi:uncharacterized membrane protein YhiD involved in acid resistance
MGPVRNFLDCPMCTGFWVGVALGILKGYPWYQPALFVSIMSYYLVLLADALSNYIGFSDRMVSQWDVDAVEEENLKGLEDREQQ